jgi:predicted NUDIX family phosphoesterase/dephospho-CoA kinase
MAVETAAIPKRLVDDVTYLWVAETVLQKHKRPLSARELVNYGLEDGLFPATGLSQTPQKSMQARLSLDILHNDQSRFVRTSRGRFLLREHLGEATRDELSFENSKLSVYTANRRVPTDPKEFVLCTPEKHYSKYIGFQGIGRIGLNDPLDFLTAAGTLYLPRTFAETMNEFKQIVTYTVIQHQSKVLSFRRGLYNRAATFLRGAHCIGFGGHVSEEDNTLFSFDDFGIRQNATREIWEELMLPEGRPNIAPQSLEYLGVLNDDSSDVGVRHLAIVLRYWVQDWAQWKNVSRGEASINRLRWVNTVGEPIDLAEYEYWSQLVIRRFFPSSMTTVPSFKIQRRSAFGKPHVLCVVGSIGSGKSATCRLFVDRGAYVEVNSGKVLARLLDLPPIPRTSRERFQAAAETFIMLPDGPRSLGAALAQEVKNAHSNRVVIDGIRHAETLEALKNATDLPVALLYVYTPPDVAFEMYSSREADDEKMTTFAKFISLYAAPVESRTRYMLGEADVITFNWLGMDAYEHTLVQLIKALGIA